LHSEKTPFDKYWTFPWKPHDKMPACKGKGPVNQKTALDPNRYNTGIPTGARNSKLVVDLDVKGDGLEEFKKYIQNHGKPTHFGLMPAAVSSAVTVIARQFARRRGVAMKAVERQLRAHIGAAIARRAARMSLATWNNYDLAADPDTAPEEFSDFARAAMSSD
jgi:hypothetical protein